MRPAWIFLVLLPAATSQDLAFPKSSDDEATEGKNSATLSNIDTYMTEGKNSDILSDILMFRYDRRKKMDIDIDTNITNM
jgi:hypothetical protein